MAELLIAQADRKNLPFRNAVEMLGFETAQRLASGPGL